MIPIIPPDVAEKRKPRAIPTYLTGGPMARPSDWVRRVNRPERDTELEGIRKSVNRSAPFGSKAWQTRTTAAWMVPRRSWQTMLTRDCVA